MGRRRKCYDSFRAAISVAIDTAVCADKEFTSRNSVRLLTCVPMEPLMGVETLVHHSLSPWRSRNSATLTQAAHVALWDRLLENLGMTEVEAVKAVVEGQDAAQPIRRFVRQAFREHFVPEDLLQAMDMERESAEVYL